MDFEGDENKNRANIKKHGVSFLEAQTVFYDPLAKVALDSDNSDLEDRFIAVGHSSSLRQLLVVHCCRKSSRMIRIISARKLTRTEKGQYEGML